MGGIAGVVVKGKTDPEPIVQRMLGALKHRGRLVRIASQSADAQADTSVAVGCCHHTAPDPRIAEDGHTATVMDGSLFGINKEHQALTIQRTFLLHVSTKNALSKIIKMPGIFACLHLENGRVTAFRDLVGFKPLYYAFNSHLVAFASERKALWRLGLDNTDRIEPGQLYYAGNHGIRRRRIFHVKRADEMSMTITEASSKLEALLKGALQRAVSGLEKVALAFSGGLDSSIIAALLKNSPIDLRLVSVGMSGSPELSIASEYANLLGLPIIREDFTLDMVETCLRRVLWLIEEPNLMKVSVAIPFYWSAMIAAREGFDVMLCGQGSDELYGGYHKYAVTLDQKGRKALSNELYDSVIKAHEVNFERDDQAVSPFGIELRTPFIDLDLIKFSFQIPIEFKVKPGQDTVRKWVLRQVATNIGLPDQVARRRKRAIQHGTKVEEAIRRLARAHNLIPDVYLKRIHEEVSKEEDMP